MISVTMKELAAAINCRYVGAQEVYFNKMVLDSRQVLPGDLFIAVAGKKTDGHNYIEQALANGAAGVLSCGAENKQILPETNYIFTDTLEESLKQVALFIKTNSAAEVIAVTGSVGKTTTKDMLYAIFSDAFTCIKTEGNFNNELGLPMTMSRVTDDTKYMILEMGMRGLGEIRYLAEIARPKYAIITNVEPVHAEILGSLENIAKAKAEISENLPPDGALIIGKNYQEILQPYISKIQAPVYTVGFEPESDLVIEEVLSEKERETQYRFRFNDQAYYISINSMGKHNIINSAMASLTGILAGLPPVSFKKLSKTSFSEMRFRINEHKGCKIINDAYNANPSSVSYALDSFQKVNSSRKIFVFGDMFELGDYEKQGHRLIASKILENKIDFVFLLGEKVTDTYQAYLQSGGDQSKIFHFTDRQDLVSSLTDIIKRGDAVLLKASRGMFFEEIEKEIEAFINDHIY